MALILVSSSDFFLSCDSGIGVSSTLSKMIICLLLPFTSAERDRKWARAREFTLQGTIFEFGEYSDVCMNPFFIIMHFAQGQ